MEQETKKWLDLADMDYGVSIRYPNELFLEEGHAKEALRMAQEILDWVKCAVNEAV